jgi:sugar lactone lactonase YvrE
LQRPRFGVGPALDPDRVEVRSREVLVATMVVLREPGEAFLLRHTGGPDAISWVERIDPTTLEPLARSDDLPGGPTWPGGIAAHANGSLYVVFGNHAHRLAPDLTLTATCELPRRRPYNSFVILPDGHLVTKDFGGVLPGEDPSALVAQPAELVVLRPDTLEVVAGCALAEPSIARLSADADTVYAVGTSTLFRARWNGTDLRLDDEFAGRYRTIEGQTYGWDAVLAVGAAWFLDNGQGSERYAGTFRGQGISAAPLHLVRVDLETAAVTLTEICGLPNGVIANPPVVDEERRIVVGYDSGNGVLVAFDIAEDGSTTERWRRDQNHACHPLLFPDTGELVTNDHDATRMADEIVVLDIETGAERVRVDAGSPLQSVVFPAAGFDRDFYYCSFAAITRVGLR